MKAIVVTPMEKGSGRIQEVPDPEPGPGEVLMDTIEVGVCGTDIEILEGQYGEAPPGDDYLTLGHENFGRVVTAPDPSDFSEGDLAACIVRRPDPVPCPQCAAGEFDMCSNGQYTERGIKGLHGFMSERFVDGPDYLVKVPSHLESIGVLMEPLTVVEKGVLQAERIQHRMTWEPHEAVVTGAGPIGLMATMLLRSKGYRVFTLDIVEKDSPRAVAVEACGAEYVKGDEESLSELAQREPGIDFIFEATGVPALVFDSIEAVGANGVVCLSGVSAGSRTLEVPADRLNLEMVLENKVVFGTVNANRTYWEAAAKDLATFEESWPGLCQRLITRRVPFEDYEEALEARAGIDVKTTISFA